ncbi:BTAD domain-containing putative transcriptional regulator [Jiangella anatolica]|uniref:AfsR/SARP family transcriptional regulator n=1 Tax=Jiangella anatolica TaxID=2670374 RepID=A0A2W2CQY0_9ACTN|nr:BTAD domain-containing putative transcriptional regulator [Jiangella anatolica]PZF82623.1 AfsR/SARP family transcriptional regulator [Jiangella anatolica]
MQVGILGPVRLSDGDRVVAVGGARLRALLTRLALEPGAVVPMPALVDAVWPDGPPGDPVNAVQTLVSRLRRLLGTGAELRQVAGGYRLELAADDVDAGRFERLARAGRDRLRAGAAAEAVTALRAALALWRGRPLADLDGAAVAGPVLSRLDELRLAAAEDLAEAELAAGTTAADVAVRLRALVAEQPLRERLRALHVRALVAAGRRAEALEAFEDARTLLADRLGADPGAQLRAAHLDALRADEPVPARPALPAPLTSLIGRDDDLAEVTKALSRARLVTLTGPGGAGKTRLAVAAAATLPVPVRLVELAAVADPEEVPQAAADALPAPGTVEPAGRTAVERLVESFGGSEIVLLLDNCEHVVDAAAELAGELLRRCPRLRVLTTSREPLRLPGEALHEVRPLAPADAVRLFAERAHDVRPELDLDPALVAEVCRRLDGLPLAIELAAARLRSLPLAELTDRLGDRFDVLTRGARTADQRHRTLRDLVGWSWELLTEPERTLLERLAVVPVVTPASAAAQGGPDAPELLAALVDKSLLQLAEGAQPRYRMLETIREFALARLTASGRRAAAEAALVASVLELTERAEPGLRSADQPQWLVRLRGEWENLRAAVQLAVGTDPATAVRLGAALAQYWTISSDHTATTHRLRRLVELDGPADPEHRAVVVAYYVLNALLGEHNPEAAPAIAGRLRGWAGAAPAAGHPVLPLLDPLLALLADETGAGLAAADRLLPAAGDWTRGGLLLVRSMLAGAGGDLAGAIADLDGAASAYRAAGDLWGESTTLTFLALMRTRSADAAAAPALERAIGLRRRLDPSDEAIEQRAWLAQLHAWTGAPEQARAELTGLAGLAAPSVHCVVLVRVLLGDLDRLGGDLAGARRWYGEAAAHAAESGEPMFVAILGTSAGHLAVAAGAADTAARELTAAATAAAHIKDLPLVAAVGVAAAALARSDREPGAAAELLGAAHALRGAADGLNPDVVELTARLRAELGQEEFATAYERGRGLAGPAANALIQDYVRRR